VLQSWTYSLAENQISQSNTADTTRQHDEDLAVGAAQHLVTKKTIWIRQV